MALQVSKKSIAFLEVKLLAENPCEDEKLSISQKLRAS